VNEARLGSWTVYWLPERLAEKLNPFVMYVTPVTVVSLPEEVADPAIVIIESGVLARRSAVVLAAPAGAATTIEFADIFPLCHA
jgi:hypothetical protein